MENKVFIIGIDGATWDLIDPLVAKGKLPALKKLLTNGSRSALESTLIPVSPAAWTSFATGTHPNKHGIFDFVHRQKGTYDPQPYNALDRKSKTIWDILSENGKKVGVLNVPGTYPVDKVNGFMVSGFPTLEELEDFTYPKNLLYELRKELGKDFRFQPNVHFQEEELFLEEIKIVTDYVYQATDYLMHSQPWDFLISVFMGADLVSHAFWKYMDSNHPRYDDQAPNKFKNAIIDVYKNLDNKIDALTKNIDSDTSLFLMSDHGFGPLYYGVSINNWLLNEGFMTLKNNLSTNMRLWMYQRGVNYYNLLKLTKLTKGMKFSKKTQKEALHNPNSFIANLMNKFFLTNKDIDWSKTIAYCMGSFGQLYINLKDREPKGIVEQNHEYNEVIDTIVQRLQQLKDPENNNIIFDNVFKKNEAYPSSSIEDDTPDILFYNSEMKYIIDKFFMFGNKNLISIHPLWSATHRHMGIFLAYNNNQIRDNNIIEKTSICDIAPTVLHIMNIPIPQHMDGTIIRNIFKEKSEPYIRKPEYQITKCDSEKDNVKIRINKLKKLGKI